MKEERIYVKRKEWEKSGMSLFIWLVLETQAK